MGTKQTSRDYFKSLLIIYYALIAGQVFFGVVSVFVNQTGNLDASLKEIRNIFLIIVPLFVIGSFFMSKFIYRKKINELKEQNDLIFKMTTYRGAVIIRYALLEGPSFFSIIVYLLTGDLLFLGLSGLVIVYFFFIKPTSEVAINDLELSIMETQLINDPDSEIAEINR